MQGDRTSHRDPGEPFWSLWSFYNSRDGRCFPSYEAIAARARCCRDTVCEALKTLEQADILTWVNRIVRERVPERDLFGKLTYRWRVVRTSNAYLFRDIHCRVPRGGRACAPAHGFLLKALRMRKCLDF